MALKPALNQFNGGEISPWLEGRFDWDKYNYSAKLCKNFIPMVEGSLKRRSGTHFVATAEDLPICFLRFFISFSDSPAMLPKTYISIEGSEEQQLPNFFSPITYSANIMYGENISYAIRAEGYQPVFGSVNVLKDEDIYVELLAISSAVTLTINPVPNNADVYINDIKTRSLTFDKSKNVKYRVEFAGQKKESILKIEEDTTLTVVLNRIVFDSANPQRRPINIQKGFYLVKVIGAGGGAGGGSYGDNRKSTGGGGGSGAGFIGVVALEGNYTIEVGSGGRGGSNRRKNGDDGFPGGKSYIGSEIIAGGGYGGTKRYPENKDGGTGNQGAGGVIEVNITPLRIDLKSDGNGGRPNSEQAGASLYFGFGQGGYGVRKEYGRNGYNGYVYIEYIGDSYNG